MVKQTESADAARQYADAYAAHYTERNISRALQLYKQLMAFHQHAPEAAYSRAQVVNIVNAVVPRHELLDVQIDMALVLLHDK